LTGPHLSRLPDVISERTFGTKVEDNLGPEIRKLYRWTRPCFCFRHPKGSSRLLARPTPSTQRATRHVSHSARSFRAPIAPVQGQTSPRSVPRPA